MPRVRIDPKEFIHSWQTSSALSDVAAHFGIDERKATAIATRYRAQGVPLKKMAHKGGPKSADWKSLAAYAKSLAGK